MSEPRGRVPAQAAVQFSAPIEINPVMMPTTSPGGPEFGVLSKPYPSAVAAFRKPESQLAPIVEPAISHGLSFLERPDGDFRLDDRRSIP